MLNEKQIAIADVLLKSLKNSTENSTIDTYEIELKELGFRDYDVRTLIDILITYYELLYYKTENVGSFTFSNLILTPNGNKAAKIGILKYIKNKEKENKKSKTPIIISIIALFIAAIQPGIALYKLVRPENETKNSYYQGKDRNNYADSVVKQVLSNNTFVEKLKDSIKHDTKFLNELKLELKIKTTDKQAPNP